jgi:hypothetical protein
VVLLARTTAQLDETRVLLREQGVPTGRISVVPADLADEKDRGRAAAAVLAAGPVDILVNNAATVEPLGPTIGIAPADLRLAFEVNVVALAALTAAVVPGMLSVGWGRVVNVSSAIVASPAGMVRGNAYAIPRPRSRRTPSTSPPNCAAPASPSTPTGRAVSTPPGRPGSAARTPTASAPACTSGSTRTTPRAA